MDLRQFLSILRGRWKFIISTLVIGTIATVGLVLNLSPVYSSSARVFVSTPTNGQADPYAATVFAAQRIASYADLATDPTVLQKVIDRLGLKMTREELAGEISADVVPQTLILQITAKAETPQLAQQIAAAESEEIVDLVKEIEKPADTNLSAAIVARVTGKASFNASPVAPNVMLDIIVGILLSTFIGVAGAVLRDLLDTTVKTRQDVEHATGNAVMATLPFDPSVRKDPLSRDDSGSLSEAFKVLRTNLQFANLDASRQMIVVSSALPDEGKTLVATNLAVSMAKSGRSVLLIDADMRNPNVADLLGLENSVGVITALIGRSTLEHAIQEHSSGVHFLGTGPRPPNPAEVLDTQAMRDLLAHARALYDVVIIDAPPLLPVADTAILMTEVDGALLLARYGSTGREQLRLAVSRVEAVGGRLFGTVLNRTPRRASTDGYGYYGYGYGVPYEIDKGKVKVKFKESESALSGTGRRAKR
ncbi:polysaccharide biosynthesis tyrosine autokinase [Aeromicrobium sp. NPDC092404]|uniref:polysaccharide biosynthesis tyrosine autokinase n=1 Tax=Aeromicrobium sp. NPDC092404 TaxID=3154976 RepID=UPI00343E953D